MKKTVLVLSIMVSAISCAQNSKTPEKTNIAALDPATMTDDQKVSYYLGMNVAPKASDLVKVLYTGKLPDGTVFDSTDNRGKQPSEFALGGVIKGWTEGIQLMNKGSQYRFYIPANLAYGDNGAGGVIPPGALLIFDVELLDFNSGNPPTTPPPPATPAKK